MDFDANYRQWLDSVHDPQLAAELKELADTADAFYKDLEFGTGGLRGVIGAGTNRMNVYTVNKATQGLCDYLKTKSGGGSAAIAYDSRIKSKEFAKSAACVFAANGITAHIFNTLMPTPVLSYAVRALNCDVGIVITASHNPSKYNGYKVYGSDGCQITLEQADSVQAAIKKVAIFSGVKALTYEKGVADGLIRLIDDSLLERFLEDIGRCAINPGLLAQTDLSIVYTPLNGTGNIPVTRILRRMGVKELTIVPEQQNPDGNFPTCQKPNPEERVAFEKAIELGKTVGADLLLATDPDCDRVGAAVRDATGRYTLLTGNETGCLLLEYILSQRKKNGTLPEKPVIIKTIVTSALADLIAKDYGAEIINTLTGFKFIGEQIGLLEKAGEQNRYIFGFEESYGYLPGSYVRDKDAVAGSMLIAELAAYHKLQGKTLLDALDALYARYGCFRHRLISFAFEGINGMEKMKRVTDALRNGKDYTFAGLAATCLRDYLASEATDVATGNKERINLPKSDVVLLALENSCEIVVRPSGTEPKLKCYLTVKAITVVDAERLLDEMQQDIADLLKKIGD